MLGVGKDIPLFVSPDGYDEYYIANPEIIKRYVGDKKSAPNVGPDAVLFKKEKEQGTFRIFVQGGSTAAGFPYGKPASLQSMLYQRFKRAYPDKNIEIISTAMAAINSYTHLDFVDEIIDQHPDLVIVYAGHNEFLGVLGVGSKLNFSAHRFLTLALIEARKLRIFQALELLIYGANKANQTENSKRTLMSTIVGDANIEFRSQQYRAGVAQFQQNLSAILSNYKRANVPVMIGSLVSNEQDQPPFSTIQTRDWNEVRSKLSKVTAKQRIKDLLSSVGDGNDAAISYELGLNFTALRDFKEARFHFKKARDLDELRFRAPSEFNHIIAQLSEEYGAMYVDTEKAFLDDTDNQILGRSHLLEHVHPNERGYFLIAAAFFEHLRQSNVLGAQAVPYSSKEAWRDIPITRVDRLSAEYVIEKLVNDYPFTSKPKKIPPLQIDSLEAEALSVKAAGINWRDYRLELARRYQQQGDLTEAAKIASGTSDAMITDAELANAAGELFLKTQDYNMALFYFLRATQSNKGSNKRHLSGLAKTYFHLGKFVESERILSNLKR